MVLGMRESIIEVHDLGKMYRLGEFVGYRTLRDAIAQAARAPFRSLRSGSAGTTLEPTMSHANGYIWALKNVSFNVHQGQAVGIIGPNGAGKSTLLKIMSRITEPTEGWAKVRGRMGSLLEVGTGFHPELTGRENILINGAILGMSRAEIAKRFDEIVEFSGIRQFIDTPVKRYSDGMRVRLGFAIAAHLEPEILVVDEVLAVGDEAFQRKCLKKMEEVTSRGRTVLYVSHNMASIQNLCETAMLLNHGRIAASGRANDVVGEYLSSLDQAQGSPLSSRTDRQGTGRLRFMDFTITGTTQSKEMAQCGAPTSFEIAYEGTPPLHDIEVYLLFYSQLGTRIFILNNSLVGKQFKDLPRKGSFICTFEKLPLIPGNYRISIVGTVDGVIADHVGNAVTIHVAEGDFYGTGRLPEASDGAGLVAIPHQWDLVERSE